jgi:hypothetical protein
MKEETLYKPANQILKLMTRKSSVDSALPLAMKDWLRLKIWERQAQVKEFEKKYGMTYEEYNTACMDGRIKDPYSYEVEKDGWE